MVATGKELRKYKSLVTVLPKRGGRENEEFPAERATFPTTHFPCVSFFLLLCYCFALNEKKERKREKKWKIKRERKEKKRGGNPKKGGNKKEGT